MSFGIQLPNQDKGFDRTIDVSVVKKIKSFVAKYGFDDEEWAKAISSQYFLLCLAEQLQWKKADYENLLNKCLSSFRVTYKGKYILDSDKLLITPDETSHIVECMKTEDDTDMYYVRSAKQMAKNIDSKQMYLNFHYGLLIRIVSSEDTEILRAIKHTCLDHLLSKKAIDSSDGWYPYRVPWITARILISLKAINYSSYSRGDELRIAIDNAITSLFRRIDENAPYWRSGVGDWVSKWESTALCLEALYVWGSIKDRTEDIRKVIEYVCLEENKRHWLFSVPSFESEDVSNNTLASVILVSVILRVSRDYFKDIYDAIYEEALNYLDRVISVILNQDIKTVRQYCTIPQILHYILVAINN